jgi:phosphoglycolate phosphatase
MLNNPRLEPPVAPAHLRTAMIPTFNPIPLKKIKLVIFDLDGTLVDSKLDLATSVNAMLRHYGRQELPIQVIGTYIGEGRR